MNKKQLAEIVADNLDMTQASVSKVITETLEVISLEMAEGGDVSLIGFGKFSSSRRAARKGRNPQTGKDIDIPATTVPKFKAGKKLKDLCKNPS